jgi:hypothetical protein
VRFAASSWRTCSAGSGGPRQRRPAWAVDGQGRHGHGRGRVVGSELARRSPVQPARLVCSS